MDEGKKYYTIGSVEKVCDLLDTLSKKSSWELNELATEIGLPKTSVHRFLLTLADKGFVVQEKRRGRYSLSYKLFSIGSKVVEKTGLLKIARPYLERILTEIDETVNLAVPSGTEMLVIDKQVSSHALRQEVRLGSTFPMINSASGRIFLAFSAEGGETVQSKIELFRERFALIRSTGVEEDDEEQYEGIRCIAVPVLDGENVACGAVSVSIPTLRYRDELVHRAREIAVEQASLISRRMGAG